MGTKLSDAERLLYMIMHAPGNTGEFNERIPGSTWLQKEAFLLKNTTPRVVLEFVGGNYGAYCKELDDARLAGIKSGHVVQPSDDKRKSLWLSEKGMDVGMSVWNGADRQMREAVMDIKKFMNDMTYDEMIAYTCSKFPETAENSSILDYFGRTRVGAACSLFGREKITLGMALVVSGMSRDELTAVLLERGIPTYYGPMDDLRMDPDTLECIATSPTWGR